MNKRKLALVTGASSGIGAEYARQLAKQGFDVIVVARRLDHLQKLKSELEQLYPGKTVIHCLQADLAQKESWTSILEASKKMGSVQVLVNNAGLGFWGPFHHFTMEQEVAMVDVNVRAVVGLTHLMVQEMLSHGLPSHIINVASVAAFQGIENYAVYCATKAFVRSFSETLHSELKKSNITVNCVSPGGTQSEFIAKAGQVLRPGTEKVMMSCEEVVAISLRKAWAKKAQTVPGFFNAFCAFLPRFLPYQWGVAIYSRAMKNSVEMVAKN